MGIINRVGGCLLACQIASAAAVAWTIQRGLLVLTDMHLFRGLVHHSARLSASRVSSEVTT